MFNSSTNKNKKFWLNFGIMNPHYVSMKNQIQLVSEPQPPSYAFLMKLSCPVHSSLISPHNQNHQGEVKRQGLRTQRAWIIQDTRGCGHENMRNCGFRFDVCEKMTAVEDRDGWKDTTPGFRLVLSTPARHLLSWCGTPACKIVWRKWKVKENSLKDRLLSHEDVGKKWRYGNR